LTEQKALSEFFVRNGMRLLGIKMHVHLRSLSDAAQTPSFKV